jgi:hypothetical protein
MKHREAAFMLGVKYGHDASVVHLLRDDDSGKALCGAKPGPNSPGWEPIGKEPANCRRCIMRNGNQQSHGEG